MVRIAPILLFGNCDCMDFISSLRTVMAQFETMDTGHCHDQRHTESHARCLVPTFRSVRRNFAAGLVFSGRPLDKKAFLTHSNLAKYPHESGTRGASANCRELGCQMLLSPVGHAYFVQPNCIGCRRDIGIRLERYVE